MIHRVKQAMPTKHAHKWLTGKKVTVKLLNTVV